MAEEDEAVEGSGDSPSDYDAEESEEDTSMEDGEDDDEDGGFKHHVGSHNGTSSRGREIEKEVHVKHAPQPKPTKVFRYKTIVHVVGCAFVVW